MNILALDPATVTGYMTEYANGIWDFKLKPYESTGVKFMNFRKALHEITILDGLVDFVVYEKPSGRHFSGVRSHCNFEGVLIEFCESNNLDYKSYVSSSIKLFATGKGNASKQMMIDSCKEKYGVVPIDDNHADAIHLYNMVKSEYFL